MFDTQFYKNRWRPLNFRRIWFFYFFFIMTSNYKNSMYPRSFLCKEAKIKQRTPLKKELCEIGEEAIWESRFTSFLFKSYRLEPNFYFLITYGVCKKRIAIVKKLRMGRTGKHWRIQFLYIDSIFYCSRFKVTALICLRNFDFANNWDSQIPPRR